LIHDVNLGVKKRYINCFLGLTELEKELTGELLAFLIVTVDIFRRFRNEELTEELQIRGYKVEKDVTIIVHLEPNEGAEIGTDKVEIIKKLTDEFIKKDRLEASQESRRGK
jgi:hypothetical protein